jgi:hypothetical protein
MEDVLGSKASILDKLWSEAEPIAIHALTVIVLEASLLLVGLCTRFLEFVLPSQEEHLFLVEWIDTVCALALVCMFGLYTLVQVGIRLFRALSSELSRKLQSNAGVQQ